MDGKPARIGKEDTDEADEEKKTKGIMSQGGGSWRTQYSNSICYVCDEIRRSTFGS